MEVENILFDFNGTIVDDLDLCLDLLNAMLEKRNHEKVNKEEYLEIFGFPIIEYYKRAGFIFPKDDFDALADYFVVEYSKRNPFCLLHNNVINLLEELTKRGKRLFIVSASEKNLLIEQLKKYQIYHYFEDISGLDNAHAKSKIESAELFVKEKKLDLEKTVFIGDTLHDKEVADVLNVNCILFTKGHQSRRRLQKANCQLIDDFLELLDLIR